MRVDIPLVCDADDVPSTLRAAVHGWSPVRDDGTGDVAVLRLERAVPAGARMPPLRRVDELWDHRFRVLGFPDGQRAGVWSTGRIRGEQGTRWFQLQSDPGDQTIEPGFSGSPVWDEESGAVVGMTVAGDINSATTTAYLIPIDQVLGLDPELLPCPYRGLDPFGEEHSAFFFGRDDDIERLAGALAGHQLVAVAGPSGVGKSSLVRAGLVPRLREAGARIVELRPEAGAVPADAVAAALATRRTAPAPDGGGSVLTDVAPDPGVVLVVDQFEELAAADPTAARELLLQLAAASATDGVQVVVTVRWESLTELTNPATDDPAVRDTVLDAGSALVAGTVIVGPMGRAQLRDAVVGPAERAPGLSFEPGLVDHILDDAGSEPGQLPLVESLLTELWERRDGGSLTLAAYRGAGGVAGAVAKRAEELLAEFPPAEHSRLLLLELGSPGEEVLVLGQPGSAGRARAMTTARCCGAPGWPPHSSGCPPARPMSPHRTRSTCAAAGPASAARCGAGASSRRCWPLLVLAAGVLAVVAQQRGNSLDERLRAANAENLGREALARAAVDPDLAARLALAGWRADPSSPQARTALATTYLANQSVSGVIADASDRAIGGLNVSSSGDVAVFAGDREPYVVMRGLTGPQPQRWAVPGLQPGAWLRMSGDGARLLTGGPGGPTRLWDTASRTAVGLPLEIPAAAAASIQLAPTGDRIAWLGPVAAGGRPAFLWDVGTRRAVAHALPPIVDQGVVALVPSADPDIVLISYGNAAAGGTRLAVRSVGTGAELRSYGANTLSAGHGALIVACRDSPDPAGAAAVSVIDPASGAEIRGLTLSVQDCKQARISADESHLVETVRQPPGTDVIAARVTGLTSGTWRDTFVPPGQESVILSQVFQYAPLLAAVPAGAADTTLLKASGRSVLQLTTTPAMDRGGLPVLRSWVVDGGTRVIAQTATADVVFDRATGARIDDAVARATPSPDYVVSPDGDIIVVGGRDHHFDVTGNGPGLAPAAGYEPGSNSGAAADGPGSARDGDRVHFVGAGKLSVLDATTLATVKGPFTVGDGGAYPPPEVRPGRRDEVAVINGTGAVELWNVATGSVTATLRTPPDRPSRVTSMAFSRDGQRLAAVTSRREIDVWDVATGAQVRPPIVLPFGAWVVGFDADGNLITGNETTTAGRQIAFWNLDTGRESGSMRLTFHAIGLLSRDGATLALDPLQWVAPNQIDLTARRWYDHLCTTSDRPFAGLDLEALPDGVDPGSPCSRAPAPTRR
ncbi:trypsin-like peptidase domain-containing protein [Pseudonocardia sp. GCM10023141]|uniref:nSTAND1 domain-containing NTPase n=1 Tax=Pseudonocardia sp. GCM10023141 TaxID=3252653 RepID=UPI00361B9147